MGSREQLVLILAAVSGSLDAIGFVALGGAFTSVMTGNLVLFGVGVAHRDGDLLVHVAAAIIAYVIGCAVGARVTGRVPSVGSDGAGGPDREQWPARVNGALLLELVLVLTFAAVWWSTSGSSGNGPQVTMLALNAAGLGVQSAAVHRFGVSGLSATYLTGTLTTLVVRLSHRQSLGELRLNGQLLASLVAGAAGSAALALYARAWAPILPIVGLLVVLAGGRRLRALEPDLSVGREPREGLLE